MGKKTSSNAQAHTSKSEVTAAAHRRTGFPAGLPQDHLLSLQQTVGNQAVQRLYKAGRLQAALKIGQPNDVYEQEADRMAEQVMRMPDKDDSRRPSAVSKGNEPEIQMKPG